MISELNLQTLRNQLEQLEQPSAICNKFEQHSVLADKELHKNIRHPHAALPIKIRLTNSKLKEADDIKEKLEILCYHLSLLRTTALTKDYKTARKAVYKLFHDKVTSMGAVISDIEDFKKHIETIDIDLKTLLSANIPLDYKLNLEKEHKRHVARLRNTYSEHSNILKNIGSVFVTFSRQMLSDNEFKSFLSQETQNIPSAALA